MLNTKSSAYEVPKGDSVNVVIKIVKKSGVKVGY